MKLFTGPLSMFGAKAQIAALEKGIAFEAVMVPFDKDDNYLPKHPEVLRINPKRQVPVLIDGEVELFDSTQIFEYLEDTAPEPPLWPREVASRARARQLEHLSDEVFFPHVIRLFGPAARHAKRGGRHGLRRLRPLLRADGRAARARASTWPAPTPSPTSPSTWRRSSPTARAPA